MGNGKQDAAAAKPTDAFKDIEKLEKDLWKQRTICAPIPSSPPATTSCPFSA